ncbi:MAG TPA: VWA domain-containing protein [Terriglobales bacterium]|nr:VWA domain-containing protein [Terriglobales bacterium]
MKTLFALLVLASVCQAQTSSVPRPPWSGSKPSASKSQPADPDQNQSTTFRVNVKLVNIFVTVTDPRGAPVGNLLKDNFQVLEDGNPQKISIFAKESALPLSIALEIDTSLSTRRDLPLELNSARRFANAILRPQDAMAIYGISEVVDPVVGFTSDMKTIDHGIDHMRMGSATALYDAIYVGSQDLEPRQGRKVMVVITDGGDTVSRTDYQEALRAAQISEAVVYSIIVVPIEASAGRDTGGEHALMQLSEDTGGKYFYATTLPQLDEAFRTISDELRTQYLLAYYPAQRLADSDYRHIDVKLTGVPESSDYRTRHRTGYYTSKSH